MHRTRYRAYLGGVLAAGLLLRYWLAFRVFDAQGFAWDLSTFADWMQTIRDNGSAAYAADPSINYPPVFAQLLQLLNRIGDHLPGYDESWNGKGPWLLLKWLPIAADLGIAALLASAGRRWYSEHVGLWAAALFCFIPVTWYDSAVWGQMDSVAALPMLAAVVLLLQRRPEWAAVLFVVGLLTKPQAVLAVLVLTPVLIGQVLHRDLRWWRIPTSVAAGVAAFAALVNTWSLAVYVDGGLAGVPVVGNLAGLVGQYFSTAELFPYLSVNAYNPWALMGDPSMAAQFQTGEVTWTTDNATLLGVPAHTLGLIVFLLVCAAVFVLLVRRQDVPTVFTAFAVLLVAFFVVTTRVHERYLVQAFAVLALVWATTWWRRLCLAMLAVANTANLHAILVGGIRTTTNIIGEPPAPAQYPHLGSPPELYGLSWPSMPVLGTVSAPIVFTVIAVVTAALVILLVDLAVRLRPSTADPRPS